MPVSPYLINASLPLALEVKALYIVEYRVAGPLPGVAAHNVEHISPGGGTHADLAAARHAGYH